MRYTKGEKFYEGKAKSAFAVTEDKDLVWLEYKNSLTAFNAQKKGEFEGKGLLNCQITDLIFRYLEKNAVKTHRVASADERSVIAKKVQIVPVEVVVRNVLAGSTAKKFNLPEGSPLEKPLVEFYYKNDELGDPFISDDQAVMLKAATLEELQILKRQALRINELLIPFFREVGIRLVDFKVEFGRYKGEIILADEISPDTCRFWDLQTGEKMDKDRFRRDLGNVKESYEKVLDLLKKNWERKL